MYCDDRVWLSVCVCSPAYLRTYSYTSNPHQIVCACYQLPWLGPPLTALRYVMYFRFGEM